MTIHYLHFGPQCPGWAYMGQAAREAAEILGRSYSAHDVRKEPQLALESKLYFPGMIVADGLRIVFPGAGHQIAEVIQRRGPLPGVQDYNQMPHASLDQVELLTKDNLDLIQGLCIPKNFAMGWDEKEKWLGGFDEPILGLVGFHEGHPVAVVELIPRKSIPYPVPEYTGYFITCLYGNQDLKSDFRLSLLTRGYSLLRENGCYGLGVVAGQETPYPNGPAGLLLEAGFRKAQRLGQVILRHRYEEIVFMSMHLG